MTPKTPPLVQSTTARASASFAALLLAGTALAGLPLGAAQAQQWTGTTSTDWNTASNWSPMAVPNGDQVVIDTTSSNPTGLTTNASENALSVGKNATGSLAISNGAALSVTQGVRIGENAGSSGTVLVTGAGTSLQALNNSEFVVGVDGSGILTIQNGASASNADARVGVHGVGVVNVIGAGSNWTNTDFISLGNDSDGQGTLNIQGGAQVTTATDVRIGDGGMGVLSLDGPGSSLTAQGDVDVGYQGTGTLTVQAGASLGATNLVLSDLNGSSGTATVTGASSLIAAQFVGVANSGAASLSILQGGRLTDTSTQVGDGGAATVLVDGANSTWTSSGAFFLGDVGDSVLTISNSGLVAVGGDSQLGIGLGGAGSGKVVVTDSGSQWTTIGDLRVGQTSNGELDVLNGATATSGTASLGFLAGATGNVTIDGAGSQWVSTALTVGAAGHGNLAVTNGGLANIQFVKDGDQAGSLGMINIQDANSKLTGVELDVAIRGTGYLMVSGGGQVLGQDGTVGGFAGSSGSATISGTGSAWTVSDQLIAGVVGVGLLTVESGGSAQGDVVDFGEDPGATGDVILTGAGSQLTATTALSVGDGGTGTLDIRQGARATSVTSSIGFATGGNGTVTVTDANSTWTNTDLFVGNGGSGTLNIQAGGLVTASDNVNVGEQTGLTNQVNIDGLGSSLQVGNALAVGDGGDGSLFITNGGVTTATFVTVANASGTTGLVSVDGAGSTFTATDTLDVGAGGAGSLSITNGAAVTSNLVVFGDGPHAFGEALITGPGSSLTSNGAITDGFQGEGNINVANGAQLSAPGGINIAVMSGAAGTLSIGGDASSAPFAPGDIITPTVTFGAGDGALVFNHTSNHYAFSAAISGPGEIVQLSGTTFLTGDSHNFTGHTSITGGGLFVNGALGGNVTVEAGASVGGTSSIGGLLTVNTGGHLIGSQGGTLTVDALTLDAGAIFDANLTTPGGSALISVTHDLTLDGSVNITSGGVFGPGIYRLIDYGGALTDNGLDIGTTPGGTSASDFAVQTSVAGQVNLVDTATLPLAFWDGAAAGHAANGAIDGGDGVWSATASTWTDANGAGTGPMNPMPGFAVFQGAPGVVTVDGSGGAISSAGMQFAVSGYTLTGDPIDLSPGQDIVRVGDGSQASTGYQATIASSLTGAGGLEKTDLGTLILTGANTYSGGTEVLDGTLQLGSGGTSGSIIGDLDTSGVLAFDRSDATSFTGVISGTGAVNQIGGGTTTLTGQNTYTGATTISSGVLALSGAGSIATSSNLVDNGGFDISGVSGGSSSITSLSGTGAVVLGANTLVVTNEVAPTTANPTSWTFSGVISGAGGLTLTGGALNLTGTNTYTGGTTISAGTVLSVGLGGTTGSIIGDILDNGAFGVFRSDAVTVSSAISGAGIFDQAGTGTTTLTGHNTYSGGTLIEAGTLVGSATSFGSGQIGVVGALVIDQPTDASLANPINGFGAFTKRGAGALNLTGVSGLTGATTVAAGRLAVNGSLAHSIVTVQNGATLGGNGTVGGVVAQAGSKIAPGNSIGTLQVAGNYSQASGSIYQAELATTGQTDLINISGTATLAHGAVLNITKTDAAAYVGGVHYTVLTAAGGVTGTYTLTGDIQVTGFGGLVATYDADDVYLVVAKNKSFAEAGLTHNQINTGSGLDGLATTTNLYGVIANSATMASARAAFDQLSGEVHASAQTALIEDGRLLRDAVTGRLRAAGGGVGAEPDAGTGAWGQVFGSWGDTSGDGNAAKLDRSTGGLFVGGDGALNEVWRAGLVAGYSRTTFSVSGRQSDGDSDNYDLGAYTGAQRGPLGFRAGATYTWHDIDTVRAVSIPGFTDRLTAKYRAGTAQLFADLGYRIDLGQSRYGQVSLEPFVDAAYVYTRSGGFQEKGSTAALDGEAGKINTPTTTLGLRGASRLEVAGATVTLRGSAGWRHAYDDVTPDTKMAFAAGGSAFDIQGAPIAKDAAALDLGVDVAAAPGLKLSLSYTGQLSGQAQDNGVKASLNWKF